MNYVNTKYRKHHRSSSDEIVVIHQSLMSQQPQLSEIREVGYFMDWIILSSGNNFFVNLDSLSDLK